MSYNNLNHMINYIKWLSSLWQPDGTVYLRLIITSIIVWTICPARHEFELSNVVVDWTCCVLAWLCKSLPFSKIARKPEIINQNLSTKFDHHTN